MKRALPVLTLAIGMALGAAVMWGLHSPEPPAAPAPTDAEIAELLPPDARRLPTDEELDPDREFYEPPPAEPPEPGSAEVEYAVAEKYAEDPPLSPVAHTLLGAWDEAPDSPDPGIRRAFVAVVDPEISDVELEALARDIYARHREATILNVRVYDSEQAARGSRLEDGGAFAYQHLVAVIRRNDRVPVEQIRVRNRELVP